MENKELENTQDEKMYLTENTKQNLKGMTGWTNFFSILNFISLAFLIMGGILIMAIGNYLQDYQATHIEEIGINFFFYIGFFYCLLGVTMIFPALYLYQFGQNINTAIFESNTEKMDIAFLKMKMYWKFMGIFTIAIIVMALVFSILLVVSASAAIPSYY